MSEFIKSWKFMAIIVAVLTVIVVGLLVYGVGTHEEAGFDDAMVFPAVEYYAPVRVCVASYSVDEDGRTSPTPDDLGAVRYVGGVINDRVGYELLHIESIQTGACWILVTVGVPVDETWDDGPGGRVRHCADSCCIDTANTGTSEMLSLALQHEFGHCLGLGHDDFDLSIMSPRLRPTPDRQVPPWITDSDRALLRARFAPEGT